MNEMIGLFDSGMGGTTILNELKRLLPYEDYIYYADSKNNPYGELSDEQLFEITERIVDYLLKRRVKIIVVACNTATTRCIKHLREAYPGVTFVGTEPAIKPACEAGYKNILVMATPGTCRSERTKWLIDTYKKEDQNVYLVPCYGLANAIEYNEFDIQDTIVKEIAQVYEDKNIDCIVLGCTHYPLIKDLISGIVGDIPIIDGSLGVARRVKSILEETNKISNNGTGKLIMINSNEL